MTVMHVRELTESWICVWLVARHLVKCTYDELARQAKQSSEGGHSQEA